MMGRKIFVSYKYADNQVQDLSSFAYGSTTVRDYVDELEDYFDSSDHIYKGESDGEDLSQLSNTTIWEKLKDRIYDSSVTIVMISPGMREPFKPDRDQWIPWEISYSLKEQSRRDSAGSPKTSRTNAMLAIVLPDSNGSYEYYLEKRTCCSSKCTTHHTNKLFKIMKENKFNKVDGNTRTCSPAGEKIWTGTCSYIEAVRWCDFIKEPESYITAAEARCNDLDSYDLCKEV